MCYACKLTKIPSGNLAMLLVLPPLSVPPDIDDLRTSSDVIASEGDDAALACYADGHPK